MTMIKDLSFPSEGKNDSIAKTKEGAGRRSPAVAVVGKRRRRRGQNKRLGNGVVPGRSPSFTFPVVVVLVRSWSSFGLADDDVQGRRRDAGSFNFFSIRGGGGGRVGKTEIGRHKGVVTSRPVASVSVQHVSELELGWLRARVSG
jgi:hypothetical protein